MKGGSFVKKNVVFIVFVFILSLFSTTVFAQEDSYLIVIKKDSCQMTIYKNNEEFENYDVCLGKLNKKGESITPSGKFNITTKIKNPAWGGNGDKTKATRGGAKNNPLGSRWMGIDNRGGKGIHGTIKPNEIGLYKSAGCIRMLNKDVETIFEYIPKGCEVWIGSDKELDTWFKELQN